MAGRHHRLNGHEFEQTPGNREGQGRLMCCSPWGSKESDTVALLHFHFSNFLSALSNHLLPLIHLWQLLMYVLSPQFFLFQNSTLDEIFSM